MFSPKIISSKQLRASFSVYALLRRQLVVSKTKAFFYKCVKSTRWFSEKFPSEAPWCYELRIKTNNPSFSPEKIAEKKSTTEMRLFADIEKKIFDEENFQIQTIKLISSLEGFCGLNLSGELWQELLQLSKKLASSLTKIESKTYIELFKQYFDEAIERNFISPIEAKRLVKLAIHYEKSCGAKFKSYGTFCYLSFCFTSFSGQDLKYVDFEGCDLRYSDFNGCEIANTNMMNCDMRGAKFASNIVHNNWLKDIMFSASQAPWLILCEPWLLEQRHRVELNVACGKKQFLLPRYKKETLEVLNHNEPDANLTFDENLKARLERLKNLKCKISADKRYSEKSKKRHLDHFNYYTFRWLLDCNFDNLDPLDLAKKMSLIKK